ncbi:carboxypeptidase B-like [Battus philenor]|uniref:carboxypeptidase B-like n=1 Tax=Battus philenor TaxID=42288 RepID=UPI0035CF7D76
MDEYLSLLSAEILYLNRMIDEEDEKEQKIKIKARGTQTNVRRLKKDKYSCVIARQQVFKKIAPTPKSRRRRVQFMDWKKYHRLSVIYSFMDDLEKDYPAICTVSDIGKSVEGRNIKMLKISNTNVSNTPVWLDACIHSREWISTAVVTYIANNIAKNFYYLPQSITNKDWYFVPVVNPDGYEFTHTNERMWRKNRAKHEGKVVGVDLNRNFSCGWGKDGDQGSSAEPNNVFYRGPAPFSEPEAVAIRDAIMNSRTAFKVFLSFHSYFELIIFPWGHIDDACPDYLNLLEGGAVMSRAIYESSGMIYKVGSTKDLTYSACGTSIDWSYTIANIPYSYMIELRSRRHKFRLPKDQIIETGKEIWSAVDKLMAYVDKT